MAPDPLRHEIVRNLFVMSRSNRRRSPLRRAYLALTNEGEVHPAPWILLGILLSFIINHIFKFIS